MEEKQKKFLQGTWLNIVLGILLFIAGIVIIVISLNNIQNISKFIAIVMASCLFLMGGIALTTSLVIYHGVRIHSSIIYGSAMIGVGVVLLILMDSIVVNIINFLAVFLISFGAAELINSIIMTAQKKMNGTKTTWIIAFYLLAAVTVALGSLVLAFNLQPDNAKFQQVIYIIVGICVSFAGLLEITAEILKIRNKKEEEKKDNDKEVIETTKEETITDTIPVSTEPEVVIKVPEENSRESTLPEENKVE